MCTVIKNIRIIASVNNVTLEVSIKKVQFGTLLLEASIVVCMSESMEDLDISLAEVLGNETRFSFPS